MMNTWEGYVTDQAIEKPISCMMNTWEGYAGESVTAGVGGMESGGEIIQYHGIPFSAESLIAFLSLVQRMEL